ncbi:MAG: 2OG-Fe(II) oxygenase [Alphaproteobacteria bacterium]|nr:2OG-Fe(II) oxygenase [Alphaproteobacteria bacterium]MBV9370774.1 2OG-Fe(II) oxygenase [Alphaproteobacteria bacterium]MBV9899847.1 2OG-Fe(II) oxygenase [Alphaproteobacteria bacterium]
MDAASALMAQAAALLEAGRRAEAVLLVNRLAADGEAEALFTLAEWRLRGDVLPQDLGLARALYGRAGDAGHARGAAFHTNLLALGLGGARNWPQALKRLRIEARGDRRRREAAALVDRMTLTGQGDPVAVPAARPLSASPDVRLVPGLLSPAECDYLARVAEPGYGPSIVVDPSTGRDYRDPVRTSDGSTLHWLIEDPAVHALNRRLAAATGTAAEQGEPMQILRYRPGQQYRRHLDHIPGEANQRLATALVYLNEGYEGGETLFTASGLKVKGRKGDALLFRNMLEDGRPDPAAEHAGLPVTRGVKLLASRWIRQARHLPG